MGVMNDAEILKAIDQKLLYIEPLAANDIQPASIDLHLHHIIDVPTLNGPLDMAHTSKEDLEKLAKHVDIKDGYTLQPGQWVTGYSLEKIKLTSRITGRIFNRISLVKWGLNAALSAFINPGFSGRKVIVLHNFGSQAIVIYPEMRICQLELEMLESNAMRSFEDRHDVSKITWSGLNLNCDCKTIDNPFSEYLNAQIKLAAGR